MFRLIAESYDNYVAKKFALALRGRSYTTTPEEMGRVLELLQSDKEEFFLLTESLPVTELAESLKQVDDTPDHTVYQFCFRSPHPTGDKVNDQAYGKFYRCKVDPLAPTLLILPGWMTYKEEKYYTEPLGKMLLKAKINYIFYSLPYHMERTPRGRLSGEFTVSGNMFRTIEAFRQAISECRTIIQWLKQGSSAKVGVLGISLGGWYASNLLHLDTGLDFAILAIPAVNPTAGLWQTRIAEPIRKDLQKLGFDEERYHELVQPLNPMSYPPVLHPKKILVIRAKFDQCVPATALEQYCRFLKCAQVKRYRQSHFSFLRTRKPIKAIVQFIRNQM